MMQNARFSLSNWASLAMKHMLFKVSTVGWRASSKTRSSFSLSVMIGFVYGIGAHSEAIANDTRQSSLEQSAPRSIRNGEYPEIQYYN